MATGRFAPSPTGRLHLGNLRTALIAWLMARSSDDGRFLLRIEDLDVAAARPEHYESQPADLRAIGLDWDGPVVRQSERRSLHDAAIDRLVDAGLTFPCWCTRKEVLEASQAPHAPPGAYPGTCRTLTDAERRTREASERRPALRLRGGDVEVTVEDRFHGTFTGIVDDLVLRRGDGTPAYNLAVVVDDTDQGVDEVVRGDDLLSSTPRQAHLARLLGLAVPVYAHVPLAVGQDGERLAKRHGAVTLDALDPDAAFALLAASLGRPDARRPQELLDGFDPAAIPRAPWVVPTDDMTDG